MELNHLLRNKIIKTKGVMLNMNEEEKTLAVSEISSAGISSAGSYVIIQPLEILDTLIRGRIFLSNEKKIFEGGDEVWYLPKDANSFILYNLNLDAVLHYHILMHRKLGAIIS
jgi:hypothetical protein